MALNFRKCHPHQEEATPSYLLTADLKKKKQKSTAHYGLVAQAVTNLKIAILTDKGRRKPLQIQNRKQQIG